MHYGGIIDVPRAQVSIAPLWRGIKLSFGVRGGSAAFSCTLLAIMPRDGAQIISKVRVLVLSVVCEPCGRRERYDVERLTRQ
jgi:hypothetical protein